MKEKRKMEGSLSISAVCTVEDERVRQYVDTCTLEPSAEQIENEVSAILCEIQCRRRYEMLTGGLPVIQNPYLEDPERIGSEQIKDQQDQMKEIRREAVQAVKTRMVIQRVIEEQQIQVSSEELEAEAHALAQRIQMPFEMVKDFLGADFAMLARDLKERKAAAYICSMA